MDDHRPAGGEPTDDDYSYEDFDDDFVWTEPDDELDVIDLDALDDATVEEAVTGDDDALLDPATVRLLDTLEQLDHAVKPARDLLPRVPDQTGDDVDDDAGADDEDTGDLGEPTGSAEIPIDVDEDEAAYDINAADEPDVTESEIERASEAPGAAVDEPLDELLDDTPDDATATTAAMPDVRDTQPPDSADVESILASADTLAPEPLPPDWVYHVLIALPDDLSVQVLELRSTGDVIDMPPPGIGLAGSFRTDDLAAVERALARWTRNQLPLQIEITGVLAEVVDEQQYVAAWLLQPEDDLRDAQHDLRHVLAPLIQPLPETRLALRVDLVISDHVPARRYPHLIGRMQADFEPFVWHATDLLLVRKDAGADEGTWEIARRYD